MLQQVINFQMPILVGIWKFTTRTNYTACCSEQVNRLIYLYFDIYEDNIFFKEKVYNLGLYNNLQLSQTAIVYPFWHLKAGTLHGRNISLKQY